MNRKVVQSKTMDAWRKKKRCINDKEEEEEQQQKNATELMDLDPEIIHLVLLVDPLSFGKELAMCCSKTYRVWSLWIGDRERELLRSVDCSLDRIPPRSCINQLGEDGDISFYCKGLDKMKNERYEVGACRYCREWPVWVGSNMSGIMADFCDTCFTDAKPICTICGVCALGPDLFCSKCGRWYCEECGYKSMDTDPYNPICIEHHRETENAKQIKP